MLITDDLQLVIKAVLTISHLLVLLGVFQSITVPGNNLFSNSLLPKGGLAQIETDLNLNPESMKRVLCFLEDDPNRIRKVISVI